LLGGAFTSRDRPAVDLSDGSIAQPILRSEGSIGRLRMSSLSLGLRRLKTEFVLGRPSPFGSSTVPLRSMMIWSGS
jgi:hypothetical protein